MQTGGERSRTFQVLDGFAENAYQAMSRAWVQEPQVLGLSRGAGKEIIEKLALRRDLGE